ncbi:hypothetical protein CUB07_10290 [Clostridioides difficile]|uniref:hypothetical protein n=1 Tax=Clostridioides difficile TaxID=1496 RepID=UPI001C16886B|nr:hypothetical protein [Clostridioides difficile]EGT5231427.1 hypothetical protein [Clostridioides difficile]MCX4205908.1 hypothetical protein [Clostridioides difficile]HBF5715857.1 hypothetical protein [Clostridioides difficile]
MLGHLFNNNNKVSEQDIARELQKQGYSKQETDNILRKANQNQAKKEEKKKKSDDVNILCIRSIVHYRFRANNIYQKGIKRLQ